MIGVEDMGFHYPKCENLFDHLSFGITQSSRCFIDVCLLTHSLTHQLVNTNLVVLLVDSFVAPECVWSVRMGPARVRY